MNLCIPLVRMSNRNALPLARSILLAPCDMQDLKEALFPGPENVLELENDSVWPNPGQASGFLSTVLSTSPQLLPCDGSGELSLWETRDWHFQAGSRAGFAMMQHSPRYNLGKGRSWHTFWQFRHENPKTRVGGPPPEGLPGFNSGVMLLNLEAMRQSPLYGRLLEPAQVQQLADKYRFRGHLGDQDFFTMIGMEHPELFHVLDCTWNRQLCTWWRDHGYSDVFEAYFRCEGHVKIYHGNCNTPIPEA
ncbi:hypothetical protein CB1_000389027 [Camelus ferus]|nr:hypothetical protein CB1_000389027 [Camelus ferus]